MTENKERKVPTAAYMAKDHAGIWFDLDKESAQKRGCFCKEQYGIEELVRRTDHEEERAKRYSQGRKDGKNLEKNRIKQLIQDKKEDKTHNVSELKGKWQIVLEELLEELEGEASK